MSRRMKKPFRLRHSHPHSHAKEDLGVPSGASRPQAQSHLNQGGAIHHRPRMRKQMTRREAPSSFSPFIHIGEGGSPLLGGGNRKLARQKFGQIGIPQSWIGIPPTKPALKGPQHKARFFQTRERPP